MGAANDRQVMHLFGDPRHVFANPNSRDRGFDRAEFAPDIGCGLGFRVPGIDVADASPGKKDNAGFRLSRASSCWATAEGAQGHPLRKRKTEGSEFEEIPPKQGAGEGGDRIWHGHQVSLAKAELVNHLDRPAVAEGDPGGTPERAQARFRRFGRFQACLGGERDPYRDTKSTSS